MLLALEGVVVGIGSVVCAVDGGVVWILVVLICDVVLEGVM